MNVSICSSSSSLYICLGVGTLVRSGITYPEVSSKVCHDSFCQLGNSVSLPWVIYYGAFYLHVVSSFSFIPVICLILVFFFNSLQFVLFISSIILLFIVIWILTESLPLKAIVFVLFVQIFIPYLDVTFSSLCTEICVPSSESAA